MPAAAACRVKVLAFATVGKHDVIQQPAQSASTSCTGTESWDGHLFIILLAKRKVLIP